MSDISGFDANQWEPSGDFSPIPAGEYPVVIVKSEMQDTKDKTGKFLLLEMQVVDGEFKGRLLWARLNLKNNNQQAVEIAKRQLADICRAVGKLTPRDSAELHNIPLLVRVSVKPAQGEYAAQNEVKLYRGFGAPPAPPTPQLSQAPMPPQAPAPQGRPAPWLGKK